ncbi:hypothetical protein ACWGR3_31315 [Streptomyces albidoflavus]
MATFIYAVRKFKKSAASWLSDEDLPAVVALEAMAKELDVKMTPALLSQYGLAYRSLLARAPKTSGEGGDPLDGIIPPG